MITSAAFIFDDVGRLTVPSWEWNSDQPLAIPGLARVKGQFGYDAPPVGTSTAPFRVPYACDFYFLSDWEVFAYLDGDGLAADTLVAHVYYHPHFPDGAVRMPCGPDALLRLLHDVGRREPPYAVKG